MKWPSIIGLIAQRAGASRELMSPQLSVDSQITAALSRRVQIQIGGRSLWSIPYDVALSSPFSISNYARIGYQPFSLPLITL